MRVEISQHKKRLRKTIEASSARELFEIEVLRAGAESKRLESFPCLLWELQHQLRNAFRFVRGGLPRHGGPTLRKKQGVTQGRQLPLPKPKFLQGHNSRLRSIQQ
ncbi:hypothetical protein PoB_004593800 [Plakobranchus ocellatus]|uniref:Uncharacterized protein n=1 Tax=Plakobranchus ocellatus TaxID=259542 RepID=A0AAV4BIP5_9GAST|nr:hypothetical protein PoB_004593800 [Plakobranchus ocellatus]